MTLPSLITRLREADGPSRELDVAVGQITGTNIVYVDGFQKYWYPNVTESIDAAVALAERLLPGCGHGYDFDTRRGRDKPALAWLNQSDEQWTYEGWPSANAATSALAMCLAILTAWGERQ